MKSQSKHVDGVDFWLLSLFVETEAAQQVKRSLKIFGDTQQMENMFHPDD